MSLIYTKMNEVMKEIGHISKDKKNEQQGFKFRGIDQFVNALYPALTKHGVFMTTEVISASHELKEVVRSSGKTGTDKHVSITMKYNFHAEDGSMVSSSVPAEGLDSGDKATNKALSAALKYALIQTFSIPTEDMEEGDRTSPEMGVSAPLTAGVMATLAAGTHTIPAVTGPTVEVPKARTTFRKSKPVVEAPVVSNGLNF